MGRGPCQSRKPENVVPHTTRSHCETRNSDRDYYLKQPHADSLPTAVEFYDYTRTVLEGVPTKLTTPARNRCKLVSRLAKEHYRRTDGLLGCNLCQWAKPSTAIKGDIVELHHNDPLADAPCTGRRLTIDQAIRSLIPLCPTCHRIAHAKPDWGTFTIDELRLFAPTKKE